MTFSDHQIFSLADICRGKYLDMNELAFVNQSPNTVYLVDICYLIKPFLYKVIGILYYLHVCEFFDIYRFTVCTENPDIHVLTNNKKQSMNCLRDKDHRLRRNIGYFMLGNQQESRQTFLKLFQEQQNISVYFTQLKQWRLHTSLEHQLMDAIMLLLHDQQLRDCHGTVALFKDLRV